MSIPRVGSQLTVRSVYSLTRSANYFNFNHNYYKYETLFLRIRIPYIRYATGFRIPPKICTRIRIQEALEYGSNIN